VRFPIDTESLDGRLWKLARAQWGVFSRKQAMKAHFSTAAIGRRTGSGAWVSVLPGVYRAATQPESLQLRLMAACLWAGDDAVVSHRSAAQLHGLEGVAARTLDRVRGLEGVPAGQRRGLIELTIPVGRKLRAPGVLVHRSRKLERADRTTIDGMPVTGLARTLIDLSPALDEEHLGVAIDSGLARHPDIDVRMLRRALGRLKSKGRAGTHALEERLEERALSAVHLASALERAFLAVVRRTGLPRPVERYDVLEGGRRIAQVDFAYPRQRIAIELHGASIHRRLDKWEHDQEQQSDLTAAGWGVLVVTWSQLQKKESEVVARLKRLFELGARARAQ
jgi:very-short-patch-repair endonuclease